jgi:hypothetical protein
MVNVLNKMGKFCIQFENNNNNNNNNKTKQNMPTSSICYDYIIMNVFPLLKKEQKESFKKEQC